MEFAIPGFVKRFCTPNAIFTLMEYVNGYASKETKEAALARIAAEISTLPEKEQQTVKSGLEKIAKGEADVHI